MELQGRKNTDPKCDTAFGENDLFPCKEMAYWPVSH